MDSRDGNVQQNHPTLCRNGCGFYSNAGNEGLCSVCYKDIVKKKQAPPNNMPASLAPTPGSMASLSIEEGSNSSSGSSFGGAAGGGGSPPSFINSASTFGGGGSSLETGSPTVPTVPEKAEDIAAAAAAAGADDGKDGKKKKNRCQSCKKKVGLTGFTCRCGGLYCSIHRYSDKHICGFDYKELGAEEIRKSNPVVVAEKVAKI